MPSDCKINKVVITTVPFIDDNTPLAAPAVLKAALEKNNIKCVGIDLNIEIYNKIQNHPHRNLFLDFFYHQIIKEEIVDELNRMLDFYVTEILSHSPDLVGLSLFTYCSQVFTLWLCSKLRYRAPDVKIIIGGPGLQTLENSMFKFPERVKHKGLIDAFITGDAELALVEYVRGNLTYPGINSLSWQPVPNFNELPLPDFSDYRFFRYNYPLLPIIDSRGCVQDCEFCDVITFWKKFQYLTADKIYQMITDYIATYGLYRFQFSSSICNGNLREFKKLVKLIAEHNKHANSQEQIHWVGSFIVRSEAQHPESLWQDIKDSNGFLFTGVESVVEQVRMNLGKRFTNADLDHHLKMGKKYKVPMNLLMIAAYPSETPEQFEQSKQWFIDRKDFVNDPIQKIQVTLLNILPSTRLEKKLDQIEFRKGGSERRDRRLELTQVMEQCGFNVQII